MPTRERIRRGAVVLALLLLLATTGCSLLDSMAGIPPDGTGAMPDGPGSPPAQGTIGWYLYGGAAGGLGVLELLRRAYVAHRSMKGGSRAQPQLDALREELVDRGVLPAEGEPYSPPGGA